jgi:hypothetical protein
MELEPNGSLILKYLQKKKEINDSLEIQRTTPTRIQTGSLGFFIIELPVQGSIYPEVTHWLFLLKSGKVGTCANVELIWVL